MASWRKIAVCGAGVLVVSAVAFVGWRHWEANHRMSLQASAFRLRAEQGDAKAEESLSRMYFFGQGVPQDYGEALRWSRKAAEQGYAVAQVNLGLMYDFGKGVPENHAEAVSWYRKAAKQGNTEAEASLGYAYYSGRGVPQDDSEAVRWYRKAADQGYALAQSWLGFLYEKGRGVQKDDAQAAAWYRKAADQGYVLAEGDLAQMYACGRGVPRDRREAIRWYRKAAAQGDARAKSALASLGSPPRPAAGVRYFLLCQALLCLFGAPLFLWSPLARLLRGGKLRDWRQAAEALLGVVFLASAGLSLYASAHDIFYSPYGLAVLFAGLVLSAAAVALVVLLFAPAKRKPNTTKA